MEFGVITQADFHADGALVYFVAEPSPDLYLGVGLESGLVEVKIILVSVAVLVRDGKKIVNRLNLVFQSGYAQIGAVGQNFAVIVSVFPVNDGQRSDRAFGVVNLAERNRVH